MVTIEMAARQTVPSGGAFRADTFRERLATVMQADPRLLTVSSSDEGQGHSFQISVAAGYWDEATARRAANEIEAYNLYQLSIDLSRGGASADEVRFVVIDAPPPQVAVRPQIVDRLPPAPSPNPPGVRSSPAPPPSGSGSPAPPPPKGAPLAPLWTVQVYDDPACDGKVAESFDAPAAGACTSESATLAGLGGKSWGQMYDGDEAFLCVASGGTCGNLLPKAFTQIRDGIFAPNALTKAEIDAQCARVPVRTCAAVPGFPALGFKYVARAAGQGVAPGGGGAGAAVGITFLILFLIGGAGAAYWYVTRVYKGGRGALSFARFNDSRRGSLGGGTTMQTPQARTGTRNSAALARARSGRTPTVNVLPTPDVGGYTAPLPVMTAPLALNDAAAQSAAEEGAAIDAKDATGAQAAL